MISKASKSGSIVGDRYEIINWLAAGGMQNVFVARDRLFERTVALKTPLSMTENGRFGRTAILSARINDSNVAKTLDYVEQAGQCFLIEEFIEGCDLQFILDHKLPYLPPSTCARLLHQLSKSLVASHAVDVVHRDLKPSNIMIVNDLKFSNAKVTDFGIAALAKEEIDGFLKTQGESTAVSRTVMGAIPFLAPECIRDFKMAGPASDIWAIGAIIYRAVSGKFPFGDGLRAVERILHLVQPPKPDLIIAPQFQPTGEELLSVIYKCLDKDPTRRPTAAELCSIMEGVCYAIADYEVGKISRIHSANITFATGIKAPDIMCHRQSFYGICNRTIGGEVWFARYPGSGNDRAFPIVSLKQS